MAEEYQYPKQRKQFGRPPQFEDFDGIKMVGTVAPDNSKAENFVLRNPNKLILDNIPQLSYHSVSKRFDRHSHLFENRYSFNFNLGQH